MDKERIIADNEYLEHFVARLVEVAKQSTCKRSKCGSIIVDRDGNIIGEGFNSMPLDAVGDCFKDGLPPGFKSDRTCCVHAETRCIMDALKWGDDRIRGSAIYFLRLDENDNPVRAGRPYCTICSKMALDVGLSRFVLWHDQGWTSYDTKHYNELSFQYGSESKTK